MNLSLREISSKDNDIFRNIARKISGLSFQRRDEKRILVCLYTGKRNSSLGLSTNAIITLRGFDNLILLGTRNQSSRFVK